VDSEKKQYDESMDDIFERFEMFENEHNFREAAPKLELSMNSSSVPRSTGWKSGFLNAPKKIQKDLARMHASETIPKRNLVAQAATEVASSIEVPVEVKKAEPNIAFTGKIVERFQ